jgi:threonine dehydrogenase-like Zn-dependent dehydrogenase
MLGLWLEKKRVSLRESALPRLPRGHALIRLRLAGICNTDLELQAGYYGFVGRPGHEFVGDVIRCQNSADDASWQGRRVVGEINLGCGRCALCAQGMQRHCARRRVLGIVNWPGAFAEYLSLPVTNLLAVPGHLPDEEAVFVEPLAAACEIEEQLPEFVQPGREALVLGDGKLGLLITQFLLLRGCRVTLLGRYQDKLNIARQAGARTLLRLPEKARHSLVVDATGSADGLRTAVSHCQSRGVVVMKSTVKDHVSIDMAPVIVNEIRLVGSRCGRFEPALHLLAQRKLLLRQMIEAEYPLHEGVVAFQHAARRGARKVLLRNSQT